MVTFQRETLARCWDECYKLCVDHYKEVALDQDQVPLDPDKQGYLDFEQNGSLHLFTARDENDKMIAYHICFIKHHLHYKSTVHAITDVYFVDPQYRNNGVGYNYFKALLEDLKLQGVKKVISGTKIHLDHSKLFEALGFKKADILLTKLL